MTDQFKVYKYRWVVLGVFMFINLTIQILWIAYAPITGPAAAYYGVSDMAIGFLAMSFMIAFIPLSIPVSWAIDTFGFHKTVGVGAALMGVCGIARGLAGNNYVLVLLATIGLAASQPFLLNAWTKVPALWFPARERATVVGLVTLANLVGTAIGMVVTPMLANSISIAAIQLLYGSLAAVSAVLFILFAREKPHTPPCIAGDDERALMLDGLKHAFSVRSFRLYLIIMFIGLGIFNGVSTWIESIIRPRGFSPQDAGTVGALMLAGGVLGAVILPIFSDRSGRRKPFILVGFLLGMPGLLGITFAGSSWLLYAAAAWTGFFLVGVNPIGMQYASEIARPTPEGTSNGLIQLCGQASVVFVYLMAALRLPGGSFTPGLLAAAALMLGAVLLVSLLDEPGRKVVGGPGL
ncbi:MAG: MFS transporter [Spirochaetes bacterium]|nr:MFS transporter [Spirochaetota bacterium]